MNGLMKPIILGALIVAIGIFLGAQRFAYGEGQQSHSDIKAGQLSSVQSACVNRAATKQIAQAGEFAKRQLDAMKEHRSTIKLTLLERRMNEEICLEEAKCFGDDVLIVGTMFDSCLTSVEHNKTSD